MMDDKKLVSEYKKLQNQAAPDLWDRIEAEIEPIDRSEPETQVTPLIRKRRRFRPYYGLTAAALAGFVVLAGRIADSSNKSAAPAATYAAAEAAEPEMTAAETAGGDFAERNSAGANERPADDSEAYEAAEETMVAMEGNTAGEYEAAPEETPGGGAISTAVKSLAVPDNAVTVPADEQYFSEAILKETGLLGAAEVTDVSFAYDESGKAVYVIYEIVMEEVLYAEDYIGKAETMTIRSPIIKTDGDEAYVLYQMQVGESYLLPLKQQESEWELLYPFAPQIQLIGAQSYRFHSGYASLINEQTAVTKGDKEGENDFYYDRMLIREDTAFLSDFISLVR